MERSVTIRVFFSFDYTEDLWRASVVRNRWIDDPSLASGGFWDAGFDSSLPSGEDLERFVDAQIRMSDVTAVLIGARTANCAHVQYAIQRSAELGRGLVGIYVDQCKNRYGMHCARGANPFDRITATGVMGDESFEAGVPVYDWVADDGFAHLPEWIGEALERSPARG